MTATDRPIHKLRIEDRQIRVFISSTFRDMQKERDVLVRKIFPQLRKLCEERAVTWTEVDLRWGIPDEQKAEGKVLPLCLAEIEHTRPYFIGLLGERYGWVPDPSEFSEELIEQQPWLKEHLDGVSVTELEILHGVLRNKCMEDHAYFYFRDPAYVASSGLSEEERKELIERPIPFEIEKYSPEEAACRTERRKERLAELKKKIIDSKFPVEQAYANPEELGELVLRDFTELINDLYPVKEVPDAVDRERQAHEAYGQNRAFAFVPRPSYAEQLDVYVAGNDSKPFVVLGESGSGKSALLADWAARYRKVHPDEFLIVHFIGSTPDSANWLQITRRIMSELKKRFDLEEEIPIDPGKVRETFPAWLVQVATRGKIVIVLDTLNQLEDQDSAPDLGWMPVAWPLNFRWIFSSLPGRSLTALQTRGWLDNSRSMELALFTVEERRKAIHEYLEIYRKDLGADRTERLASAEQAANPLYLRAVLDELRQFGIHELLDKYLNDYLDAPDLPQLFKRILVRWEKDFDCGTGLVKDSLSLIWASRNGLSETELLEILQKQNPSLTRHDWTPFYLAAESNLVTRGGMLNLGHAYLKSAVQESYLPSEEHIRNVRNRLASYFTSIEGVTDRKLDELPWLLFENQAWDALKDVLTDIPFFLKMRQDRRKWELHRYWLQLSKYHNAEIAYRDSLNLWLAILNSDAHEIPHILNAIAGFHADRGEFMAAEPLYRQALGAMERVLGPEHLNTLRILNNLAGLFYDKGDYAVAEPLYRRDLEENERVLGLEHPDTLISVNNLARLLSNKGDYAAAEPLFRRAFEAMQRVFGPEHPHTFASINNLAFLHLCKGDYTPAEPLFRRALEASERVLGMEHPDTMKSVNNLAGLLECKGDYAAAEPFYQRALDVRERVLGLEHPETLMSVNNLAGLLEHKGDYAAAEPLFRRALEANERVLGTEHPDTFGSMNNLAFLLSRKGDFAAAEPLFRRALEANEKVLGPEHPNTLKSVNNLAFLLSRKGDHVAAESFLRRALDARDRVLGPAHPDTLSSVSNLADSLLSKGDYEAAEPFCRRALEARERVLGLEHHDTLISMNNLAELLSCKGDYTAAEPLFQRAFGSMEHMLGPEHPDTLIIANNLAKLLYRKGDYAAAEPLCRRALEGLLQLSAKIKRAHPNLQAFIDNYAGLLEKMGSTDQGILNCLNSICKPFGMQVGNQSENATSI
jgi:nephrocystin-3